MFWLYLKPLFKFIYLIILNYINSVNYNMMILTHIETYIYSGSKSI